jgi:membrane protein implicated in regulation of membrane protease activity
MWAFRNRVYRRFRGQPPPPVHPGPAGGVITLPVSLAPGESCQAEHSGTFWTVRNIGTSPLLAGTRARIASVQDLTLLVRSDV